MNGNGITSRIESLLVSNIMIRSMPMPKPPAPGQPSDKTTTPAQRQGHAMAEAIDIHGTAFKNGSATLLARIVGAAGANGPSRKRCRMPVDRWHLDRWARGSGPSVEEGPR